MGGAQRALPGAAGRRDGRRALRDRAQDRRPRHLARVRGRRARARRHARERRGGRGGHAEPAHHRCDTAARGGRSAAARGARRDLPAAGGVCAPERAARGGRRADLHEPAQLGRRLDSPARSRARRLAAAVDVVLRDRGGRRPRVRDPPRVDGLAPRPRLPREPRSGGARHGRAGGGRLRGLAGAARPARLRDRRRRREGRRARAAAPARRGRARAARSDRMEVPAHHRHDHAEPGGLERGPHRPHGPVRGARAGAGVGRDREARHPPQRGGPAPQGRARRRRGDRDACRRRDPAGGVADLEGAEVEVKKRTTLSLQSGAPRAIRPPSNRKGACGPSARIGRGAPGRSSRRSSTLSVRWTSTALARRTCAASCPRG